MNKYFEYNLINSIPIIYPVDNQIKYSLCPRYTIADSKKILQCFNSHHRASEITLETAKFKYIKYYINYSFQTMNNDIEALYCYIIVDSITDYNINYKKHKDLESWLKNDINDHYMFVTTPILKYKDIYYSIANDSDISVISHTLHELNEDEHMIQKLIKNNCYTICDNYNIVISLYHEKLLTKEQFCETTVLLEKLKNFYYTPMIWMYHMNNHRMLNACDFPVLYLLTKSDMVDKRILDLYDWNTAHKNCSIYMQNFYKHDILFTTMLSFTYPLLHTELIEHILGHNLAQNLWVGHVNIPYYFQLLGDNGIICSDFYGIFASFAYNNSLWKFWILEKFECIKRLKENYRQNAFYLLSDMLIPLFHLYTVGYESIKIKKCRIHQIWKDVINIIDTEKTIIPMIIENYMISKKIVKIPYVFLLDVYNNYNIDFVQYRQIACKYTNLYKILNDNKSEDSLYYFHKNVLHKRVIYILICIYKKFHKSTEQGYYTIGTILIEYLKNNRNYLV